MGRSTRYYVGIDFGTTNSSVARIAVRNTKRAARTPSEPEVISLRGGYGTGELIRTVLFFNPDGRTQIEEVPAFENPERGIFSLKRKIMENRDFTKKVDGRVYGVEELTAMFLRELLRKAHITSAEMERLVFSVPTYGGEALKDVLWAAAERLGLSTDEIWFVDEPIAVLWDYKDTLIQRLTGDALVLVFDFGGGTLDLAVMAKGTPLDAVTAEGEHGQYRRGKILAKRGIPVGGDDLDEVVVRLLIEKGKDQGNGVCQQIDTALFDSPERLQRFRDHPVYARLKRRAETVKMALSQDETVTVSVPPLLPKVDRLGILDVPVERDTFVQGAALIWQQIREGLERLGQDLQADSGLSLSGIEAVLLSGGSSQVPYVLDILEEMLPQARLIFDDALQTRICRGNARYGRDEHELVIEDTVGTMFGVYNHRLGEVSRLIRERDTYPIQVTRRLATTHPCQEAIDIMPMYGKDGAYAQLVKAGRRVCFKMRIRPVETVGDYERFTLSFAMDKAQRLQITAFDHQFQETVGIEEIEWKKEEDLQ